MLLFAGSLNFSEAQSLTDTTKQFSLYELKLLASYLDELKYRREAMDLMENEIQTLQSLITSLDNQNRLFSEKNNFLEEKISLYEKQIETITPPFYDNYVFGLVNGIVLSLVIFFLAK